MASEREIFDISGPLHLTSVDWKNSDHRRSIAASLVQGVYILERDRQQQRLGPQALAPPWWDFFHFQLLQVLVDDVDASIFGAIYQFKFPPFYNYSIQTPPRYIIAFRGTVNKPESKSRDLKLDFHVILNKLHQSSRFHHATQAVQQIVSVAGASNIWLAGHSLGASIALNIGKNIVKTGFHVETYLFNPPFMSPPIERIKSEKLKHGIRIAGSIVTAGVAAAVNSFQKENEFSFGDLSEWVPYLFINPADPICAEYIGYFAHRDKMEGIGAGAIGRLATQHSIGSLVSGLRGGRDSGALHLLPSAYLTINLSPCLEFKKAHGIHQWWRLDIHSDTRLHQFK